MLEKNELASVTYSCKTKKGYPFRLTAVLFDHYGFEYGNNHGIGVIEESGYEYGLDARYDSRFTTVQGFYDNILDVLKDRYEIATAKLTAKE